MIIKTFEGININDIIKDIKKSFGMNATILSSTEETVPNSKMKLYKIKAASSEESNENNDSSYLKDSKSLFSDKLCDEIISLNKKIDKLSYSSLNENKLSLILNQLNEIKTQQQIFSTFNHKKHNKNLRDELQKIHHNLTTKGLHDNNAYSLISYLDSIPIDGTETSNFSDLYKFYEDLSIQWVVENSNFLNIENDIANDQNIHIFLGPEGSGKSSLIAKLATKLKRKFNKQIIVLSIDKRTIPQVSTLRDYSKILGIKHSTLDSLETVSKLPHNQIILIDFDNTPLIDPTIEKQEENICHPCFSAKKHLVLSITNKSSVLKNHCYFYKKLNIDSFSFTGLDLCGNYGEMLSLSKEFKTPMSLFSNSNSLSQDLSTLDIKILIDNLFRPESCLKRKFDNEK